MSMCGSQRSVADWGPKRRRRGSSGRPDTHGVMTQRRSGIPRSGTLWRKFNRDQPESAQVRHRARCGSLSQTTTPPMRRAQGQEQDPLLTALAAPRQGQDPAKAKTSYLPCLPQRAPSFGASSAQAGRGDSWARTRSKSGRQAPLGDICKSGPGRQTPAIQIWARATNSGDLCVGPGDKLRRRLQICLWANSALPLG